MNLNISYNWLKDYVKLADSAEDFAKKISLCGPSVDHLIDTKPNFSEVVVGQIISIEQHPNADKLHVCKVNVGKNELQIVCGAPNILAGQKVPVVLVGGKVGDFEIKEAKLRGVESQGMMCSQKELGIGEDHTGIYILPDYVEVGLPFEKVMPLADTIMDMEVTSNRPDAMSIIGIAREASAILGAKFLYKEPIVSAKAKDCEALPLKVTIKEPSLCPRYDAAVMTDIKVEASPLWMQQRLLSAGMRPINNLVDITNYILLEFGQPMHVFDYEKLAGQEIIVRLAQTGESILALDGKTYDLKPDNLVIADGKNPCAVGGVMGGELSAASENTVSIVLESANFDPVSIRRTARGLNLHSDASDLYEKGLHPKGTGPALARAIELVMELAGGKLAGDIISINHHKEKVKEIKLNPENVTKHLGVEIKAERMADILADLGFTVSGKKELTVTVPWWREKDIEGEHDLTEEIARIYGYHNLPTELMPGVIPMDLESADNFAFEDQVKDILCGFGHTEIYSYSFISEKMITGAGLDPLDHVRIANPLSSDFEYMRTTLVPSMLLTISENAGLYSDMRLFELSKIYLKHEGELPQEPMALAIAIVGSDEDKILSELRGIWDGLTAKLRLDCRLTDFNKKDSYWSGTAISINGKNDAIGGMGLISKDTLAKYGIKKSVAIINVDFAGLLSAANLSATYTPIPKYPAITLDLSMEIDSHFTFGQIKDTAVSVDNELIKSVDFLSVFKGQGIVEGKKALAIRVTYRHADKTLSLDEAQAVHNKVVDTLKKEYNILVR